MDLNHDVRCNRPAGFLTSSGNVKCENWWRMVVVRHWSLPACFGDGGFTIRWPGHPPGKLTREPGAPARVFQWRFSGFRRLTDSKKLPGRSPGLPCVLCKKEQTPLPHLSVPHPLVFTADVSVFEAHLPESLYGYVKENSYKQEGQKQHESYHQIACWRLDFCRGRHDGFIGRR